LVTGDNRKILSGQGNLQCRCQFNQDIGRTEKSKSDKGAIPELLTDALSVSFDPHVGHDYLLDSDDRYLFYHKTEKKIPFDLEYFNKITQGGYLLKL